MKKNHLIIVFIALVCLLCASFAFADRADLSAAGAMALPFAIGAIKVRDEIGMVRTVKATLAGATVKDTIYLVQGNVALAINSADANAVNVFMIGGLIEYAKPSTQVWKTGQKLYWDSGNSVFTNLFDPGYVLAGIAAEDAANPSATGMVILIPKVKIFPTSKVTNVTTAGAATYAIGALLGGLITRDPAGGNRDDVTPTAAQIVAGLPDPVAGSSFEFTIRNTADAAETITVTAGDAGVTLSGTMTIAQNNSKRFLAVITNPASGSEAVTVYSLGTVVH